MRQSILIALSLLSANGFAQEVAGLSLQQCIELSLTKNADIRTAQANTDEYRARLSEVQANYYPKLTMLAYASPMFTVQGDALHEDVERKYDLGSWGPSTHLQMLLAVPVYTFGRLESGVEAAQARLEVENAKLHEVENRLKLDVTKLYYTHLFSLSMQKELSDAKTRLQEIQNKAQELYDSAAGKVTKADLMRLRFNETELSKVQLIVADAVSISLAGIKHLIGMLPEEELQLIETELIEPTFTTPEALDNLLVTARQHRPEWDQINRATQAATALRQSESATKLPVLFVAGNLETNWTPTRDDATNPYHYDPYNGVNGGIALGAKLDLDWALSKAKIDRANAELSKVKALQQKAATGIPVQVQKARNDIIRIEAQLALAKEAMKASRKWVVFSSASYMGGVGDVKEVLEGLAAQLQSRRDYLETGMQAYVAQAELKYALGL